MRTLFFSSLAANLRDVPEPVNILHHPQQIRIFLEVYRPDHTFGIYFPKRRQRRTARGLRSRARGMLVWIFRESFFFSLRTNPSTFLSLSASGRFVSKKYKSERIEKKQRQRQKTKNQKQTYIKARSGSVSKISAKNKHANDIISRTCFECRFLFVKGISVERGSLSRFVFGGTADNSRGIHSCPTIGRGRNDDRKERS